MKNETYLHRGLVQALRKERFGRVCHDEPADTTHTANTMSQVLMWSMICSIGFFVAFRLGRGVWQAVGSISLLIILLTLFAAATKRFGTAALFVALLWLAAGVAACVEGGGRALLVTHALPFGVVVASVIMWRAVALASGIPFLLPVALVVVFLPLLTQDVWVVGADSGWQLLTLACIALGPLLGVLGVRQLRTDVRGAFDRAAVRVAAREGTEVEVAELVKFAPGEDRGDPPPDEWLVRELGQAFDAEALADEATELGWELTQTVRRQALFRLTRLVIGIGGFFGLFVYLLAWAAVPIPTSQSWTNRPVRTESLEIFGWAFELPAAPYTSVAFLLSIVATGAFLAFALTEDRYSTALSDVLVQQPVERCLLLAAPYRRLCRRSR